MFLAKISCFRVILLMIIEYPQIINRNKQPKRRINH